MKLYNLGVIALLSIISFCGCNSYIQRTVMQSFSRINDSIPNPPHMVRTPAIPNAKLCVSWAGHATTLIQIHDKIFLTDPLFTNSIGMVVKRNVKSGIDPAILSKVDVTCVSHLHFDHLSYASLSAIPGKGILVIPQGISRYVPDLDFKNVFELRPWDSIEEDSVRITAVPALHFSGRYGFDRGWMGDTGYTGYVIEYKGIAVFFAGDTGYDSEFFKEVGRRFKIDLAIVPIAPSSGSGVGSHVHVSPLGALTIFKDIGASYLVPIHFGTLLFGSPADPEGPIKQLRSQASAMGILNRIVDLQAGEQRVLY